jgi:ankyrin repeat protein
LDKNPRDSSGSTPLHDAAFKGHLKVCQLLLENIEEKNPVDKKGWTPLYLAAQNGHKHICQLIMEYIDMENHEKSHTQMAKRNGLLEFVRLFIDQLTNVFMAILSSQIKWGPTFFVDRIFFFNVL